MDIQKTKEYLKKLSPSRKLILGFLAAIIIGTLLLMMPFSLNEGKELSFLSSMFTIVSAICVTPTEHQHECGSVIPPIHPKQW